MSATWVEASAPCSLSLCGGWAVALDRRASARVERVAGTGLEVEWPERLLRVGGAEGRAGGGLGFALELLERHGAREGLRVTLRCRVPDESGLAPALALGEALSLALEESGFVAPAPTAAAQARAAACRFGGVAGGPSGALAARLACDPARVEEALTLIESGLAAPAGPAPPAPLELDRRLEAADWAGLGRDLASCWPAPPPAFRGLVDEAGRLGGGAWLAAGDGGLLVAWLPAGGRAALLARAREAGLRPVGARLDLLGRALEGHGSRG